MVRSETTPRDLEYFADVFLILKESHNNEFLDIMDRKAILNGFLKRGNMQLVRTQLYDTPELAAKYNGGFTYSKVYQIRFIERDAFCDFCIGIPLILDNWKYINIAIATHMQPLDTQNNITPGCSRITAEEEGNRIVEHGVDKDGQIY